MKTVIQTLIVVCFILAPDKLRGDSSIQLFNTPLSRMQLFDPATGASVPVPTSLRLVFGAFMNGSQQPVLPLGYSSTNYPGIIETDPQFLPLPGTVVHEIVQLQVRGWSAEYGVDWKAAREAGAYYGETDVRSIQMEGQAPGIPIWQGLISTYTNRFYPLVITVPDGLHLGSITVAEGDSGVYQAVFPVRLLRPSDRPVTVDFTTQDGSAVGGQDYVPVQGTLAFAPGETLQMIRVQVTADGPVEPDETFSVVLSNPVNATLKKAEATCLITEARVIQIQLDVAVTIHTVAGRRYAVEQKSNTADWTLVPGAEDVLGVGGPMTIYDVGAGGKGVRYYRTRLLSP